MMLNLTHYYKKSSMDLINTRISFYTSNNHLNYRHLKKGIQYCHSKYVFVSCRQSILIIVEAGSKVIMSLVRYLR